MARAEPRLVYDVVVVGGGPVGLLLAYQLARFGMSVCVFEKEDKDTQDTTGRAIALFSRTLELLDQLDLADEMLQQGFACRESVTYKDGVQQIPGRVWTFMENIQGSMFDFALVLRQKYVEAILRRKLDEAGAHYFSSVECVNIDINETASLSEHGVTINIERRPNGTRENVQCKYVVGADGGRSFVRRHVGIPFEGDTTVDKWIRIDGMVETDMPINRAYGAIESRTHGNVLWAPLDHGATRIGYALSPEIIAKYPKGIDETAAVDEALLSCAPFNVKFNEVHWWTVYTIGQRIARDFAHKRRLFLCGDAAHTHSSGAAQGLNTGIHDAVNLAWKLALFARGSVSEKVLGTYQTERRSAVERLINYDKDISMLMTNKWPAWYTGDKHEDPHIILGEIFEKAASFNTGLGISYAANIVNQPPSSPDLTKIVPGARCPDIALTTPGTQRPTNLYTVLRNKAKFHVVVFAGRTDFTQPVLRSLHKSLSMDGHGLLTNPAVEFWTISSTVRPSTFEALGTEPFGRMYYDPTAKGHEAYGIDSQRGGIVILRPDGLVGTACAIDGSAVQAYFALLLTDL